MPFRFIPIFDDVFGTETNSIGTPVKRKGKVRSINWNQVKSTTWLLFIYAKSNFPGISDDLGIGNKLFLINHTYETKTRTDKSKFILVTYCCHKLYLFECSGNQTKQTFAQS